MIKVKAEKKWPGTELTKNIQYELFSTFVTNDSQDMSNVIDVWESIPKYFFTPKQVKKLRNPDGLSEPYKWSYIYDGTLFEVKIQPALIEQGDGTHQAFFPGATEELIEEVLKKILVDQHYGLHDPEKLETWVRFSLSMIQRELKAKGRDRNRNQIRQAIEIMAGCIITLHKEEKEIWKGSILQDLITIGRKEYLEDHSVHHIARLPILISTAINNLKYRQFNYTCLMGCSEQLSRWLYKRIINRYRQASLMNSYHFMYSDLEQGSALLQQNRQIDNRRKVIAALDELVGHRVLSSYNVEIRKEKRTITDVKYTVWPGQNFIREQKSANKRQSDIQASGLLSSG